MFHNDRFINLLIQLLGITVCFGFAFLMYVFTLSLVQSGEIGFVVTLTTLATVVLGLMGALFTTTIYISRKRHLVEEAMEKTKMKMSQRERNTFYDLLISDPDKAVEMLNLVEAR